MVENIMFTEVLILVLVEYNQTMRAGSFICITSLS